MGCPSAVRFPWSIVTLVDRRYLEWCIGVLKVKSGRLIWSGRLTYRYISLYLSSLTCLLVGTVRLYPGPPSVTEGMRA
jgi:hypothetical protein